MRVIRSLTAADLQRLEHCWEFWARPTQLAPEGDWRVWLIMAGRGFGKTRAGVGWVIQRAMRNPKARIHLVARTAADVHGVMLYGESGILAKSPPDFRPTHNPSKRRLTWPNGAIAETFSADEPDTLRGPQCTDAWADEPAAWRYQDAWDQLMFGLRLGSDPRCVATTTPRPTKFIRSLATSSTTRVTRGTTYENKANLAPAFLEQIVKRYEGTRLGRQELDGDILDDSPSALWRREAMLDALRVGAAPELRAIVIAVDPATTTGEASDETGIIVAGLGVDGHGYVLEDLSGKYTPAEWGGLVVTQYKAREANRIVAERNQGGDLVESNIRTAARDKRVVVAVRTIHAAKAKRVRAEPVAALYEQRRVHHVGAFPHLEDQLCSWEPDVLDGHGRPKKQASPDRLDALVYALTDLMVDRTPPPPPRGIVDTPILPFG